MNFDNMPQLRWKYGSFLVLGVNVGACVLLHRSSGATAGCRTQNRDTRFARCRPLAVRVEGRDLSRCPRREEGACRASWTS
jgi:hypothetical protein